MAKTDGQRRKHLIMAPPNDITIEIAAGSSASSSSLSFDHISG
jgi:hypothetical protein